MQRKFVIFTDLDGCLLDHDSYRWESARPALQRISELKIPLIFNTSKTLSEVRLLREEIGNHHPFITENGMVTSIPANYFFEASDEDRLIHYFHGQPYKAIRRSLRLLRENQGFQFSGFGDLSVNEISQLTGLSTLKSEMASARKASEPIVWNDSDHALEAFTTALMKERLHLTRGGRFYHIAGEGNKGLAALKLLNQYQSFNPNVEWITVGLGDGINDLPLLEAVDIKVLINTEHGVAPDVAHLPDVIKSQGTGPESWNKAVLQLLEQLPLEHLN